MLLKQINIKIQYKIFDPKQKLPAVTPTQWSLDSKWFLKGESNLQIFILILVNWYF